MASYKLPFTGPEVEDRLNKVTDLEKNKANRSEIPSVPVQSVNGKTGDVTLSAADVGADPAGTASSAVTEHNTATDAHNDIRLWLSNVETWVKNLLDADDETLNQTSEMIQYMKDNRELIEQITTGKVSVTDIINNLTTNVSDKPLSAAQGVVLKGLIDALQTAVNAAAKATDLTSHTENTSVHITAAERTKWNQAVTDVGNLSEEIADLKGGEIPEYWEEHLTEKIEAIKALHRQYGKDCFSFVHMADVHYTANLGKRSPVLARKIMDETQIKFALVNGDMQTRGCHETKDALMAENELILEMFEPLKGKALFQKGNHDGAYGKLDRDGNGTLNNSDSSGTVYPENERETYIHNLTPQEFHEYCYRKVGMVGDVHFDETGTAYYVHDTANDARFIGLNTQCNDYELQEDGTQKYPTMWLMRFTQAQFDFLINEALVNGVTDKTKIVIFGHVPLWQEIGDRDVMCGVLKAYKDKATYSGEYDGTASAKPAYTNKAEPLPNNTTDTELWVNNYRFSSSGISAETGTTICNYIPCVVGNVLWIEGVVFRESQDRFCLCKEDKSNLAVGYMSNPGSDRITVEQVDDKYKITILAPATGFIRFAFKTPEDASKVIITVNEEIAESAHGYDYVSVDCDFTNAKGELVGSFSGHVHSDNNTSDKGFPIITTRSDAAEENDATLKAERVAGTITEQSFDVFTVTPDKIYATKIGAGSDREISR